MSKRNQQDTILLETDPRIHYNDNTPTVQAWSHQPWAANGSTGTFATTPLIGASLTITYEEPVIGFEYWGFQHTNATGVCFIRVGYQPEQPPSAQQLALISFQGDPGPPVMLFSSQLPTPAILTSMMLFNRNADAMNMVSFVFIPPSSTPTSLVNTAMGTTLTPTPTMAGLAPSTTESLKSSSSGVIAGISVGAAAVLCATLWLIYWYILQRRRKNQLTINSEEDVSPFPVDSGILSGYSDPQGDSFHSPHFVSEKPSQRALRVSQDPTIPGYSGSMNDISGLSGSPRVYRKSR